MTHTAIGAQVRNKWWSKDTVKLMRIPFSYFLMPVFVFAVSQAPVPDLHSALICFIALHLFIYPASNGYNSYMDNDEGSIGGLKHPPKPTRKLFYMSLLFDAIGLMLSLSVGPRFCACVLAYILASRAYSYKGIRLKKYPFMAFFTIVFFQGAFTYWMVYNGVNATAMEFSSHSLLVLTACLFLIGGFYPLTQVYQHDEDRRHGDTTISLLLGYTGTFVFTSAMFLFAAVLLFFYFYSTGALGRFWLFLLFTLPVLVYFVRWFTQVLKSHSAASFQHTMRMNLLGSTCLNICFITFLIINATR